MMSSPPPTDRYKTQRTIAARMERIMDKQHPLCKEDIVWVLNMVKSKLSCNDEALSALDADRIKRNFCYFAEVSVMLLQHNKFDQESDRLRFYLAEAAYGLWSPAMQDD